ncbi:MULTISPECIES: T9SS type A sorting domain-containing protein [Chryseobacterium]|uniref:T9SS type A sorting domain-containing protein n=1 Tax=Chryseobacterium TaxID=59732 RepID=UPI00195E8358|nr:MULTISPECIES: T9SS type A sorting domain-containing protein [Chryseobacterium]MBM7417902.1 hypothetical protein [Chryseobacterium sp. JUb44]MDH6212101.1 hypothetical protein [Chryseobacterium sp. BIGb0186]WSO10721.1 T9SS type A sorting domain-containing protein [Chryseobacterium scophthalmum]
MKTKNIFLIFVLNLIFITTFAQRENDNWYFGNKAAVNFSSVNPNVLNDSQIQSFEACGTVSDSNTGNLLFYCTNNTIFNRNHQTMQNGSGLLGGTSSQQLIIVKNPSNSNQYFVFITPEAVWNGNNPDIIRYSIVDMSLGNISNGAPLGAVMQNFKNIPILDNLGNTFRTEAITAVASTTPNEYWILIPNQNQLFSYKINSQGLSNGNPVISNLNYQTNLTHLKVFSIKASPRLNSSNFTNYICISNWASLNVNDPNLNKVLSFNSATGSITNHFSLDVNNNNYQTYLPEFNRDASILFLGYKNIFAIDLLNSTSSNINVLQIFNDTSSFNSGTALQRNKYGDIYINRHGSNFLGRINNPDVFGSSINVNLNDIYLGSNKFTTYGLPQLVPLFEEASCIDSLTLTTEPNLSFYYEIGNKITTKDRYVIGSKHDITMQAGQIVNLLPGTYIQLGAKYHAFIAPCRKESFASKNLKSNNNQQNMVLDLDMEERKTVSKQLEIHPNPASTFINIDSGNEKINSWELLDISGRSVLKGSSNKINVQSLPKATYLLNININNKIITKKVIVK